MILNKCISAHRILYSCTVHVQVLYALLVQHQAKIESLQAEVQNVQEQLEHEQESLHNLETVMQASRDKEFKSSMELQERATELAAVRERCQQTEARIESMNREVHQLRSRNLDLDSELDKLRRQLTNERFERCVASMAIS